MADNSTVIKEWLDLVRVIKLRQRLDAETESLGVFIVSKFYLQ